MLTKINIRCLYSSDCPSYLKLHVIRRALTNKLKIFHLSKNFEKSQEFFLFTKQVMSKGVFIINKETEIFNKFCKTNLFCFSV